MNKLLLTVVSMLMATSLSAQVFYKVEGNGLSKPSYLFGTHHLAPLSVATEFGVMPPFNSAGQVVGEIDMTQGQMQMSMKMQPFMIAPADSTLSKVISPEDMAVINEEFKKWTPMPGLELSALEPMKPMAVTTIVAASIAMKSMPGFNPQEQLDSWFQTQGSKDGKKIIPLETVEQQAEILFNQTPIAYQAEALVELLKDTDKAIKSTQELTDAYMAQDLKKMAELSEAESEHPEFMAALLDRRNESWLKQLPAILSNGPTFVAVGALHLAGDKGLVEGLRRLGYSVTPLK